MWFGVSSPYPTTALGCLRSTWEVACRPLRQDEAEFDHSPQKMCLLTYLLSKQG